MKLIKMNFLLMENSLKRAMIINQIAFKSPIKVTIYSKNNVENLQLSINNQQSKKIIELIIRKNY
jgi:hypothetical protein